MQPSCVHCSVARSCQQGTGHKHGTLLSETDTNANGSLFAGQSLDVGDHICSTARFKKQWVNSLCMMLKANKGHVHEDECRCFVDPENTDDYQLSPLMFIYYKSTLSDTRLRFAKSEI